jgi:hypothetical protein
LASIPDPKFKIADYSNDTLMLFLCMFILNMSHDDETLPNVIKRKHTKKGRGNQKNKGQGKFKIRSIVYFIRFSI